MVELDYIDLVIWVSGVQWAGIHSETGQLETCYDETNYKVNVQYIILFHALKI